MWLCTNRKTRQFYKIRKENFQFLYNLLEDLEDELILPKATQFSEPSWFGFPISVREHSKIDRDSILKSLNNKKIGTRLLFAGNLTRQPYMEKLNFKTSGNLVNTDFIMNNTLWIGLQPSLNKEMLSYSVETIKKIIKSK